jgi:hypothetical protein
MPCFVPGDTRDIGAGDPEIAQIVIVQAIELAQRPKVMSSTSERAHYRATQVIAGGKRSRDSFAHVASTMMYIARFLCPAAHKTESLPTWRFSAAPPCKCVRN